MLTVQKFGGSSLAGVESLRRSAGIAAAQARGGERVVVVVSARGDLTDDLLSQAGSVSGAPSGRELDALLSTGEQASAALMAMTLDGMGVPAVSLTGAQAGIHAAGPHGDADISRVSTGRILDELRAGYVSVVAGFQGEDGAGDVSTLGRGGSDTTAVALAAALGADKCDIYTDVDGIYTADPRLVPGAVRLAVMDYRDMLLLAGSGSQVLHSKCVKIAMKHGVEIRLRSASGFGPGTLVTDLSDDRRPLIAGLTRDKAECTVTAVGRGADDAALVKMYSAVLKAGIDCADAGRKDGCARLRVSECQLTLALCEAHAALFE